MTCHPFGGLDNLRQIETDTTRGDRVIAPGEVEDIEIPGPLPTIRVLAVMYADGSRSPCDIDRSGMPILTSVT
jgi:hypothetical protein